MTMLHNQMPDIEPEAPPAIGDTYWNVSPWILGALLAATLIVGVAEWAFRKDWSTRIRPAGLVLAWGGVGIAWFAFVVVTFLVFAV